MQPFEQFFIFIDKHVPWLGFILMSVIGGVVAHVREWESKFPGYSFQQHCFAILRRTIMAVLAGAMWFLIMKGQGWLDSPYSYVGASLVGLFAPEFFDFLWDLFKKRVGGVTTSPPNNGGKP